MDYLKYTMKGLSNIVHNVSQHPSEQSCNDILDNLVRTIKDYNRATGNDVDIKDYRKK